MEIGFKQHLHFGETAVGKVCVMEGERKDDGVASKATHE